jgi:multiple sugar transport system substrate-binding protein
MSRLQKFSAALLAGVASLYLQGAVAAAATLPEEKATIEIWWHDYGPMTVYLRQLIDEYQKAHPNVTINATVTSSADINRKTSVALADGTGPHIMDNDASFYSLYYNKGELEPLNLMVFGAKSYPEFIARFTPGGLDAATFAGKVYALPYQGNSMSLFMNNKEFRAAGLDPSKDAPRTWDDVMKLGPKLTIKQGTRTVQKAFDFPYHGNRWEVQDFQPLTEQFGGRLLSDDGKAAYLNSPEAVQALTLWRDVTNAAGDPGTTMNTSSNPNQDFVDGRTAMYITGPWATPQVLQSPVGNDFTVVSLPQVNPAKPHTLVYGWMWGVNMAKSEAEKAVAWDFVRFMVAKPEEWLDKVGFVQPVKGVETSSVAREFPFYNVHMKDVSTGSWYIRSEFTNEITQSLGRAIERVIYDGADPKASLDQAQAEAERVLNK